MNREGHIRLCEGLQVNSCGLLSFSKLFIGTCSLHTHQLSETLATAMTLPAFRGTAS